MKQKILNILIIFICLFGLNLIISNKSYAVQARGTVGTCGWEITDDGTLIIHEGTINFDNPSTFNWTWNYSNYSNLIYKVEATENIKCVNSLKSMFWNLSNVTEIDLSGLDTLEVTNMSQMITFCKNLKYINVSNFNTSNVTNMWYMFSSCSSLISVDVSNFDTSNVTNLGCMFNYCSSLTSVDVSNFDTSNVTSMNSMFSGCTSLTSVDVSNFDTSKVTNLECIFSGCSSLTSVDVSNFDTSNVTSMDSMFSCCTSLTSIDVSNFDTSNVTDMCYMFFRCTSMKVINLKSFDVSNLTKCYLMFGNCDEDRALTEETMSEAKYSHKQAWVNILKESYCDVTESLLETILVSDKWKMPDDVESYGMFLNLPNLIGGNGTKYENDNVDGNYAISDSNEIEGYLTLCYDVIVNNQENTDNINSNIEVNYGNNQDIIVIPNLGYKISKIIDNDNEVVIDSGEEYTYQLVDVKENHNVKVETTPIEYVIISGDNQERKEKNTEDLTITSDGLFEIFTGLEINGKELVEDKDYTVKKGSTIVTLSKEYLDTLSKGEYEIKFKYSNGSEPVGTMKIANSNVVNNSSVGGNGDSSQPQTTSNNAITKALYTGDNILKVTVPIILVIIILNFIQVKLQKSGKVNKKPRIGRK